MGYETRNGSVVRTGRKATAPARPRYPVGKLNRYDCQTCDGLIITIDRDKGVTPFALACRATSGCRGDMFSSFYQGATGKPTFEWRKPTPVEYAAGSVGMRAHFDQGGLDLYPINGAVASRAQVTP